ncbi:hypothetical protein GALMADRAFT_227454 [Galerina marginata CBS 339.88]|uniref:Uncharacterized protein n=1 Tax=Galerina marginata (strain CBS 339.88) TaxID=685588 RepID=A0A067STZ2_GALM3|nr:hypothetical protein GALMADRAFT_227454 [Galerina marginata CBS 339.88]
MARSGILGSGWVQSFIGGGVRSSSSTSYLRSANSRSNLSVLINAHRSQKNLYQEWSSCLRWCYVWE